MQMGQMLVLFRQSILRSTTDQRDATVSRVQCSLFTGDQISQPEVYFHFSAFRSVQGGIFILAMTEYICILYGASNQWDCAIYSIQPTAGNTCTEHRLLSLDDIIYSAPFIRALCYISSMSYKMVRLNKYIRSLQYPVHSFLYHSILWQPVSYTEQYSMR